MESHSNYSTYLRIVRNLDTKVRKKAKIRNCYNQVPYTTQDTAWESDKSTRKHHIHESQEASLFPTDDHKTARNRHGCMAKTSINNKDVVSDYFEFPLFAI